MRFQNQPARRVITMHDLETNANLRLFYRIIRFSRLIKVALGICMVILILRIGV